MVVDQSGEFFIRAKWVGFRVEVEVDEHGGDAKELGCSQFEIDDFVRLLAAFVDVGSCFGVQTANDERLPI